MTVAEYLELAEECRQRAAEMEPGEDRDALLSMANAWEHLARKREPVCA